MAFELARVYAEFFTLLKNNATILSTVGYNTKHQVPNIYRETAPPGVTYPCIVMKSNSGTRFSSARYIQGIGAEKVCLKGVMDIIFYTDTPDYAICVTIADILETIFHTDQTENDDVFIGYHVESPISYTYENDGRVYTATGVRVGYMAYAI